MAQPNNLEHLGWLAGEGGSFILAAAKATPWSGGAFVRKRSLVRAMRRTRTLGLAAILRFLQMCRGLDASAMLN